MIANAIKSLVLSVSSAIAPSMGSVLSKNDTENSNKQFSVYELGIWIISCIAFTCGIILIVPFVTVYTSNLTDAEYIQPLFGPMIVIAEMIYCCRDPYISVTYAAGHFKQTAVYAYAEALINIVLSVILVGMWGLPGVAVGTIVSMFVRTVLVVVYLKDNILYRSPLVFMKKMFIFGGASAVFVIIAEHLPFVYDTSYITWALYAVPCGAACAVVMGMLGFLFFRNDFMYLLKRVMRKA